MDLSFLRVATVVPHVNVADCDFNTNNIIDQCFVAAEQGAKIILFPELSVTSYTCGDLFNQSLLLDNAEKSLVYIKERTKELDCVVIVGAPLRNNGKCYNCAVVMLHGCFIGVVPKTYIPSGIGVNEKRWFASSIINSNEFVKIGDFEVPFGSDLLFEQGAVKFCIEIGHDLLTPVPPSTYASLNGANVILNLSARDETVGGYNYLKSLIEVHSSKCSSAYVVSSSGSGESTTDTAYVGCALIVENGKVLGEAARYGHNGMIEIRDIDIELLNNNRRMLDFINDLASDIKKTYKEIPVCGVELLHGGYVSLLRSIRRNPFIPSNDAELQNRCEEVVNIQVEALIKRLKFTGIKNVVIGVSGGLDSTLALLVCHSAFNRMGYDVKGIKAITMPGFGTTDRTYMNALDLMRQLNVDQKEISIKKSVEQHFVDIDHDIKVHDVTYENSQARERTQILMDYSNKCNGLVVGTGDLSELALGWATYNGDHMSMYGVNASVPKTLVQHLVRWFALNSDENTKKILLDIVDTPISPELVPADELGNIKQKTEDLVGPYELHDFFLYYFIRFGFSPRKIYNLAISAVEGEYEPETVKKWLRTFVRRFFKQQFKRSCLPDGPGIGTVSLSPRGYWSMPSDASMALWIEECDKLCEK